MKTSRNIETAESLWNSHIYVGGWKLSIWGVMNFKKLKELVGVYTSVWTRGLGGVQMLIIS